ncbi:hypothetical protein CDAR_563381 [Caerostris darwini]|uniref:Uncharacterized protein n=1 Tax=Caerostris darwini TaxID=1538125 RepID=A0AAV4X7B1_9ARAC|nr:hypothetical protein CDAR_563381 [Caerostris darwini]
MIVSYSLSVEGESTSLGMRDMTSSVSLRKCSVITRTKVCYRQSSNHTREAGCTTWKFPASMFLRKADALAAGGLIQDCWLQSACFLQSGFPGRPCLLINVINLEKSLWRNTKTDTRKFPMGEEEFCLDKIVYDAEDRRDIITCVPSL